LSDWLQAASELLYREASCLDEQRWDEWIALYEETCEFWVPAWKSEHQLTADPRAELSLVFYRNRAGLEERVERVRSGRSPASSPLPRTHHAITNVRLQARTEDAMTVASGWTVHEYSTRTSQSSVLFGRYEHGLVLRSDGWRIRRKKVVIVNDCLPAAVDFYSF